MLGSTLWSAVLLLLIFCVPVAADDALVAYYTFNEGSGTVAHDSSGNHLDGTIHGATYVKSPHGFALHFNGVDDYVDCGNDPRFNLDGDLTIEAWLRQEKIDGRNRMIFGDSAGLTINRNYNLRIDQEDLRFEYGDGISGPAAIAKKPFFLNRWQHIAFVLEYPRYYVYRDGELISSGDAGKRITRTQGANRVIGGWFAGHFQGDIDELRLYNRGLTEREIHDHASVPSDRRAEPHWEMNQAYYPSRGRLDINLFGTWIDEDHLPVEARLLRQSKVVHSVSGVVKETRPASHRGIASLRFDVSAVPPGEYEIDVTVRTPGGQTVKRLAAAFTAIARPSWLGSRVGITDAVLPPFTPLQRHGSSFAVWGRSYDFDGAPWIHQIESKGAPLFDGPPRIVAEIDGRPVQWRVGRAMVNSASGAKAQLQQTVTGGPVSITITNSLEYDGFLSSDWTVKAAQPVTINRLIVEIPVRREHARYFYDWPVDHSGALTGDVALPFRPVVWLGDEDRGFEWLTESDQFWRPADSKRAIEVHVTDRSAVLRLNLIQTPVHLTPTQPIPYWFGLQATPLKPITKDAWDYRIFRNEWYGYSLDLPSKEIDGKPALQHYRDAGARAMLVLRWWDAFSYTRPLGHEAEFRKLVAACHENGIGVVPYVGGFLLSEKAPEFAAFHNEMMIRPPFLFPINRMPGMAPQDTYIVCHRSSWQDFLVAGIDKLMADYHVDGVYLDTTILPWACSNEAHGCGYTDATGVRRPTYPIRATRETLRRIYTVVKQHNPDGIVDVHPYDAMLAPALAYATSYWNGEQLARGKEFKPDALPLDRFRTEFMGVNWGVPADLLYYVIGDYRISTGLALLHNVPVRVEKTKDLDFESAIWHVRDEFGCKDATWHPYWNNSDLVTASPDGAYVSFFRHPRNGLLAVIANFGRADGTVTVAWQLSKLSLPATATAKDALTNESLPLHDGVLTLPLKSQEWKLVWVR